MRFVQLLFFRHALAFFPFISLCNFSLHQFKNLRINNCFMVIFYIILRQYDFTVFCEMPSSCAIFKYPMPCLRKDMICCFCDSVIL